MTFRPSPIPFPYRRAGRWRTIDLLSQYDAIPREPGVYVFIRDRRVVYVGMSANLHARLAAYRPRRRPVDYDTDDHSPVLHPYADGSILKISVSRRYGDWLMRELRLIRKLRPLHNLAGRE